MNEYRFDVSNFTIADSMAVMQAAQMNNTNEVLRIANRFIPINIFALPYTEIPIVLQCFLEALMPLRTVDPIDQLIRRALEDTK